MNICFNSCGEVTELTCGGVEFISPDRSCELFVLQLRDAVGNPLRFTSRQFEQVDITEKDDSRTLRFSGCKRLPGAQVDVSVRIGETEIAWSIAGDTGTRHDQWEWVDFPKINLAEIFGGNYLLPFAEGTLIDDLKLRKPEPNSPERYVEYPMNGAGGFYPGPAPVQFQAYYTPKGGMGFYCFDPEHSPKTLDMVPDGENAVTLTMQQFTGGKSGLNYEIVFAGFQGDWQNAAEIYRNWMIPHDPTLPRPLTERMPEWFAESPVFVIYPVRGIGLDLGGMEPNEYFPYNKALPTIDRYKTCWNSPLMVLLMHWEGTAPWAPPYIWPPFGGEENLREFADRLHRDGNLLGLYGSGIGWTQRSRIDPRYECFDRFEKDHVREEICIGPRGEAFSRICQGQRMGYDLCAGRRFTADTVTGEITSAVNAGVDYLQYFDQNQGGAAPLCYSKSHGHPSLPGAWQTAAMRTLFQTAAKAAGKTVLGCENGAAEPYMNECRINDLRNHLAWGACGKPVPLYSYLFHEYVSGFSGNGVCLSNWVDLERTPFFLQWSLGWNFACGNLLSVVLKDGGEIHWHWALPWSVRAPKQEPLRKLIANLTGWRRGSAGKYLIGGRMQKAPETFSAAKTVYLKERPPMTVPAVTVSAWSAGGKRAVILVNGNENGEPCRIQFASVTDGEIITHDGRETFQGDSLILTVPPLDMVLFEFTETI